MATGPTGPVKTMEELKQEMEDMNDEGCRLAHELQRADAYLEDKNIEIGKLKDKVFDLECECAVFKAERDQADEKVEELELRIVSLKSERDDLLDEVKKLRMDLQEWVDFEGWRQGRWVLVQQELKRLREENASLKEKNEDEPVVSSS